jgi:hypothetical protein
MRNGEKLDDESSAEDCLYGGQLEMLVLDGHFVSSGGTCLVVSDDRFLEGFVSSCHMVMY